MAWMTGPLMEPPVLTIPQRGLRVEMYLLSFQPLLTLITTYGLKIPGQSGGCLKLHWVEAPNFLGDPRRHSFQVPYPNGGAGKLRKGNVTNTRYTGLQGPGGMTPLQLPILKFGAKNEQLFPLKISKVSIHWRLSLEILVWAATASPSFSQLLLQAT